MNKEQIKRGIERYLKVKYGKSSIKDAKDFEIFNALSLTLLEGIVDDWNHTEELYEKEKNAYYFSAEYLMGRALGNNLISLGLYNEVKEVLDELGFDLNRIEEIEEDAGLGNGGLGRLAACFMDSGASLEVPLKGYGIRYNNGLFSQYFEDGFQKEDVDSWLKYGEPWSIRKEDEFVTVDFEDMTVKAIPYDTPIIGYASKNINTLRLWKCEPVKEFDFKLFNEQKYDEALELKNRAEDISRVLYPNDSNYAGRLLRLKQEYFFVSAGLQDIIRKCKKNKVSMRDLPKKVAIHINDTHPTLCIPELMRILLDEEGFSWDEAWDITTRVMSYTNHTILAEALEKWPVEMMKKLLPRIYMIIEEIDRRYVEYLQSKYHDDWGKINYMRIINNGEVRMAHLCIRGSHSVNGVAKLHTEILKHEELKDFYNDEPYKFNNKTNGIAHRRWLMSCNKELSDLITELIGDGWKKDTSKLKDLEKYLDNKKVLDRVGEIKYNNKVKLADYIYEKQGIKVDPNSIFDVQIKRLHAYKRQLLNVLHILYLYHEILDNPEFEIIPRTFIFGAKAAPGYYLAKCIIKLINSVADLINNDPRVKDKVKVVFIENYGVSIAEKIIPAANVSEQISTTTKEASGTGNMKLMMNGAITMATMDGANVEISEQVGKENMFIFGLNAEQVLEYNKCGGYSSKDLYHSDRKIKRVVDDLVNGFIPGLGKDGIAIYDSLITYNDEYFVLRDFYSYIEAQKSLQELYRNQDLWNKISLKNTACSGFFSSDRTIEEYINDIWFKEGER